MEDLSLVHRLVLLAALYPEEGTVEKAKDHADTICSWDERKTELLALNNWLSQEYVHMVEALTFMVTTDNAYLEGTDCPPPSLFGLPESVAITVSRICGTLSDLS